MQSEYGEKNYVYLWVRYIFSLFLNPMWMGVSNYNRVICMYLELQYKMSKNELFHEFKHFNQSKK